MNRKPHSTTAEFPPQASGRKAGGKAFSVPLPLPFWLLLSLIFIALPTWAEATGANQVKQALDHYLQKALVTEARQRGWQQARLRFAVPEKSTAGLSTCPGPVQVATRSALRSGRMRFDVDCNDRDSGNGGWHFATTIEVDVLLPVWVASQTLERGTALTTAHLQQQETNLRELMRGYYQSSKPLLGMSVKRRVRPGQVLSPALLDQPVLVSRGQRLEVSAQSNGFSVSITAEALQDGAAGEVIRVRNISSGKTLEAEVTGAGRAVSTL